MEDMQAVRSSCRSFHRLNFIIFNLLLSFRIKIYRTFWPFQHRLKVKVHSTPCKQQTIKMLTQSPMETSQALVMLSRCRPPRPPPASLSRNQFNIMVTWCGGHIWRSLCLTQPADLQPNVVCAAFALLLHSDTVFQVQCTELMMWR